MVTPSPRRRAARSGCAALLLTLAACGDSASASSNPHPEWTCDGVTLTDYTIISDNPDTVKAHLSVPDPEHAGTPALIAVNGVGQSLGFAPHGPGLGDSGYQTGDYTFTGDSRGQVSYPGMTGRFYIMWARTPWNCG